MDPKQTQPSQMPTENAKSFGPLVGIIIIVILLVIGGIYMMRDTETMQETAEVSTSSTSDEVSTIESELDAEEDAEIDLSELDSI